MTIFCNSCNNDNPDGTVTCIFCGQDLRVPTIIQGVASPVIPNIGVPSIGSSGNANALSVLIPVISGFEDPTRAITLPSGYFKFNVGRTQLDQGIKPQIDLADRFPDVVDTPQGFLASRRTAVIRRDQTTDDVFFQHHPDSSIEILVQRETDDDPWLLLPGDELRLESGTVITIGKNTLYLELIAR